MPAAASARSRAGASRREFLAGGLSLATVLTACGANSPPPRGGAGSEDPVVIKHKFGSAEVPAQPQRIVTLGYNGQDFALALGVTPVGVRDFIGPYEENGRPWAREKLAGADPKLVGGEEISFERVARLKPDLILAVYSFIDSNDYELLARIAPTVAQPARYGDGGVPWQQQTVITGRALGREDRARNLVRQVEERFSTATDRHPEFQGKTAAVAFLASPSDLFILEPQDLRMRFFAALGFHAPKKTGAISRERIDLLDQDLLVCVGTERAKLERDPLFRRLDAVRDGRVVYFGDFSTDFAGALGFSSPLSLPFALDVAVPRLTAALDA